MNDFKRREFIKLSAFSFAAIALQLNSESTYAQMTIGEMEFQYYGKLG